jgi:hypothetical protein
MSRDLKGNLSCTVAGSQRPDAAIFAARIGKALLLGLFLFTLTASPAAAQPPPVFTGCQNDVQGANDEPGQKDLTRFCVAAGNGPFQLFTQWDWDLIALSGGNTGDACTLYDTDGDGNANVAVCVTIRDHGEPATLGAVRLFTCNDTRPDRCAGGVQVGGNQCVGGTNPGAPCSVESDCLGGGTCMPGPGKNTTCTVSQEPNDPFPAGDAYPQDTVATCSVDLDDFGAAGTTARLIDACSFPSEQPGSDPSDCVLFQECTTATNCDDGNACTIDSCDAQGICRHSINLGISCNDGDACTAADLCNAQGFCEGGGAVDCGDGNVCTTDSCDPATGCVHTNNNNSCVDGDACTTGDFCSGGVCHPGTPLNCDDGNVCTTDGCDPTNGCFHTNNTNPCSDGNACTTGDTCSGGACVGGPPPNCNDGNVCTNGGF